MGLDEEFKDAATIAADAAKSALDALLNGEEVAEPQIYDDLFTYYDIFLRELQARSFKEKTPEQTQAQIITYLTVVEGLMSIRSQKNQLFAQKLSMYDTYPLFFTPPQEPSPEEQMAMQEQIMGAPMPMGSGGPPEPPGKPPENPDQVPQ